ncbi:uncharacterized protein LOC62_02G003360 [Vanrija pseudolonga]|uniref:Uncharacterized protein n=1 Tax=Vanrija pseudolonga TaxID=143232 RepID=A0AAF1BJG9_9TREE|nr:hypothetical protein LOC62_02G003360 [Vanrija pseudolonga]
MTTPATTTTTSITPTSDGDLGWLTSRAHNDIIYEAFMHTVEALSRLRPNVVQELMGTVTSGPHDREHIRTAIMSVYLSRDPRTQEAIFAGCVKYYSLLRAARFPPGLRFLWFRALFAVFVWNRIDYAMDIPLDLDNPIIARAFIMPFFRAFRAAAQTASRRDDKRRLEVAASSRVSQVASISSVLCLPGSLVALYIPSFTCKLCIKRFLPRKLKRTTSLYEEPVHRLPYDTLFDREHAFRYSCHRKFIPNSLAALDLAGTDGLDADAHAVREGIVEISEQLSDVNPYTQLRIGRRRLRQMTVDDLTAAVVAFFSSHLPKVEEAKYQGWARYRHCMIASAARASRRPTSQDRRERNVHYHSMRSYASIIIIMPEGSSIHRSASV